MNINFSSIRACFGVRAANPTAATEPEQRQGGFRQAVARLCRVLFQCKSPSADLPATSQAKAIAGLSTTTHQPAREVVLVAREEIEPISTGTATSLLVKQSAADIAANASLNQQLIKPKMLELLLNGLDGKLSPETIERVAVGLSMTKTWGDDPDPLVRFSSAKTVESLPAPADLFESLKRNEPNPQAFRRMLGLIQKKFYPMIERVLDKPDVATQVSTWLCKALGDGESLPKVRLLTQLDAPMLQQFTRLLDTLETGAALPTTHHSQVIAIVKKAQLIQALLKNGSGRGPINVDVYNTLTNEQKNDKDIAIAVVSKSPNLLEQLSLTTRADKGVVTAAVKSNGEMLAHVSEELKADRDVVLHAVTNVGTALQYACDELRADPEVVLQACKDNRDIYCPDTPFEHASDSLKNDRSFVLKLVSQSGESLEHANPQFQDDYEVVKAAVSNDGKAIKHASETLRADESIVKIAVSAHHNEHPLKHASIELKDNKDVVLLAVKNSSHAFQHAGNLLQQDRDVLIAAASTTAFNEIHSFNPAAREDDDVMRAAILGSTSAFASASETLRNDKELVMAAVRKDPDQAAAYIPMQYRDDKDVMMAAVSGDGGNLYYASDRLKDDKEIVLAAVKSTLNHDVLNNASPRLRTDVDVVRAAVSTLPMQMHSIVDPQGVLRSDKSIARALFSTRETGRYTDATGNRISRFDYLSSDFRKDKAFVMEVVSKSGRNLEHVDASLRNDKQVVKAAYFQNPDSLKFASDELKNDSAFVREIYMESQKYKRLTSG